MFLSRWPGPVIITVSCRKFRLISLSLSISLCVYQSLCLSFHHLLISQSGLFGLPSFVTHIESMSFNRPGRLEADSMGISIGTSIYRTAQRWIKNQLREQLLFVRAGTFAKKLTTPVENGSESVCTRFRAVRFTNND